MEKEYDELDRKIDGILGRIGAIFRFLVIVTVIGAIWHYLLWPTIETWGTYVMFAAYLLFQLFFAIMFMIVQFAASSGSWAGPGSAGSCRVGGVGFKDYRALRSSSWPSGW